MHKREDIICFSSIDWDFIWQGHQEIMSTLAKQGHRVLFIENTGIRTPGLRDTGRLKKRLSNWYRGTQGIRQQDENLYIYSPVLLPFPYSKVSVQINTFFLHRQLKRWFESVNFYHPLIWTFLPTALVANIVRKINPKLSVYYCIDNFAASSPQAKKIKQHENNLLKQMDLIFATSHNLLENCAKYNTNSHFFPFGVSFENFQRPQSPKKPDELQNISKPIVSYISGIHKWIDFELIHELALKLPEFQFVFIGPIQTDISKLKALKNITFTGQKKRAELPSYAYYFDCCLIPYKIHDYTSCVYPTKLNEYLALGKNVICTPIREILLFNERHGNIVKVGESATEFQKHILNNKLETENTKQQRIEVAKTNSWAKRIEEIKHLISQNIEEKQNKAAQHWVHQLKYISKKYRTALLKPTMVVFLIYILLFRAPLLWLVAQPLRIEKPLKPAEVIITLGGGVGESGQAGQGYQERVQQAVQLFQSGYGEHIIFSSGFAYRFEEAKIMKALAIELGIPKDRIFIDNKGSNTYENIKNSAQIMQKNQLHSAIFISSSYHAKRISLTASKNFPYNATFQTHGVRDSSYFSNFKWRPRLHQLQAILHEYAAIVYYKFKNYI